MVTIATVEGQRWVPSVQSGRTCEPAFATASSALAGMCVEVSCCAGQSCLFVRKVFKLQQLGAGRPMRQCLVPHPCTRLPYKRCDWKRAMMRCSAMPSDELESSLGRSPVFVIRSSLVFCRRPFILALQYQRRRLEHAQPLRLCQHLDVCKVQLLQSRSYMEPAYVCAEQCTDEFIRSCGVWLFL